MKILTMYLPQFHEIEENNKWWGQGYTEWSAVKSAKPLFKTHNQPRVPLNNNYYDLSDKSASTWKWQAKLANEYGVYGFCIYHYWFCDKQLLEKPMEILLRNKDIQINYCICWANETWTKTWYGLETEVLIEQKYGSEIDWINHFNYLLQFFKDERYIKINNKPIINIYKTVDIQCLENMLKIWEKLAINNGFDGVYIVAANTAGELEKRYNLIDAYYNFEPGYTLKHKISKIDRCEYLLKTQFKNIMNKYLKTNFLERTIGIDAIYKKNWMNGKSVKKTYLGTFPMWDNTPRRSYKGLVYLNSSPEKFKENLSKIELNTEDDDFVYINAWNEWGEGCYLEPDEHYRYEYLGKLKYFK